MIQESLGNNFENQKTSENTGSLFLEKIIQKLSQESSTDSLSKASNMVLEKIDIQIKYSLEKNNILFETQDIIANSLKNTLPTHLQEYNISGFDIDKNGEIDETEEQRYLQELGKMLNQILQLQSTKKFEKIHQDIDEKWDIIGAEYLNFSQNIDENFVNNLVKSGLEISEDEYTKMREKDFNITSFESIKELGILIGNEIGTGLVDVLKLSASIFSSAALIPRYTSLRIDRFSDDKNEALAADIQIEELVRENPALGLVELLGEQGVEMIKNLANMMTSGKQGDIATTLVSIFGLLAGGAGAAKLVSNMTRKGLVNGAKKGYINTSRGIRNGIKTISNGLGNFADTMGNIDNTIAFAGAGVLLPNNLVQSENNSINNKQMQQIENSTWEINNPELPNKLMSENNLPKLTDIQLEVSQRVHLEISKGQNKNSVGDLLEMTRELKKSGVNAEQIRILMEGGIVGKFEYDITNFKLIEAQMHEKPFWGDIVDFLESKGTELSFDELVLGYIQRGAKDREEFNDWLDGLDKKGVSTEIYTELQNAHQKILIEKKLSGEISNISYKDLELFTQFADLNNLFEKLNDTKILELLRIDAEKIRSGLGSNIDITKLTPENLQKIFELAKSNDKAWLSNRLLRVNIDDYVQLSTRQIHIIESFMDGTLAGKYKYEMLINGINEGKLDINSLSHDRLTSLKNSWNKQFLTSNDIMRIEMLENGHPKLFNQEILDRFFYMGIFDIKNGDELRKIQSYLQPGGKLYEVMRGYDFQLEKIISGIENHITQLS